jgi:hypothetical protein
MVMLHPATISMLYITDYSRKCQAALGLMVFIFDA